MGILPRTSCVTRSKVNSLLNRAEGPTETLDHFYEKMCDELRQIRQGTADLTTRKKRLEIQKRRLEENVEKHDDQAHEVVQQDREDLARKVPEKKQIKMSQIEELEMQIASLQETQDRLVNKKDELQSRIEEFRTKKETMKARYEAAEASNRVSEAMTGVGDEMIDVRRVLERAEEQTDEMEARPVATDELVDSDAFDDALLDKDSIKRKLEAGRTSAEADTELGTLEAEMGKSSGSSSGKSASASDADVDIETDMTDEKVEAELEELKNEDDSSSS